MDIPQATKEDVVNEEPIDIVGRVVQQRTFDDGNTQVLLEDIDGNELKLKIWAGDLEVDGLEANAWYCFENVLGDIYEGQVSIGSNHGKINFRQLPEPPEGAAKKDSETETSTEQNDEDVVALDIETISRVSEEEFDFENSDHVELCA
jgi:hypothetical protein